MFISGIPPHVTVEQIGEMFGSIGIIKVCGILVSRRVSRVITPALFIELQYRIKSVVLKWCNDLPQIDKKLQSKKIWLYRTPSGESKGEATVTYDDPPTASAAIQWFNGKYNQYLFQVVGTRS